MHAQEPGPKFHFRKILTHLTFYWGHDAEVLFSGWPGKNPFMYALLLTFVLGIAVGVEWLSHSNIIKPGTSGLVTRVMRTGLYTVRSALSYMVMLSVMSFNGGVFLAAIAGHALGFLIFGSKAMRRSSRHSSDIPPLK